MTENETAILATFNTWSNIGFVVGPFIGGHILHLSNGYCILTLAAAVIFLVNFGGFNYYFITYTWLFKAEFVLLIFVGLGV